MAGQTFKKRSRDDTIRSKLGRPPKKAKRQVYHSDSEDAAEEQEGQDFKAVDLLDSEEEDIQNAPADDGASEEDGDSTSAGSDTDGGNNSRPAPKKNAVPKVRDAAAPGDDSEDDGDDSDDGSEDPSTSFRDTRSKRNDPTAFATSLSKILSTKLSTSRRADPVLARSAEAQEAARRAVDTALETKARKRMREQKRLAMEKGRVRDVLVATSSVGVNPQTGLLEEGMGDAGEGGEVTTAHIMATERRLRKTATRGVIKLFNAVRAAQVKATEAEKGARGEGIVGVGRREEKVTEMSRKGFLDLIASGGGGLKKGGLEEA